MAGASPATTILCRRAWAVYSSGWAAPNPFQIRRVASQTKPMQECHPERSEGSLAGQRSFAALRMTQRDGLVFEMYWRLRRPPLEPHATSLQLNKSACIMATAEKQPLQLW